MAEIKDLNKKSETIFDLARRFPNKTYRELEKYRDADRQEESAQIPLTDAQKDLISKVEAAIEKDKGVCVIGEARKDREEPNWFPDGVTFQEKYEKERKLRQEIEGELSILKGIETNRVKEAQEALADALEVNESHRKLNGKLQERLTEVEEDNKKLAHQIEDKVHKLRKAGL